MFVSLDEIYALAGYMSDLQIRDAVLCVVSG